MIIQDSNPSQGRLTDLKKHEYFLDILVRTEAYEQAAALKRSIDREKKLRDMEGGR